MSAKTRSKTPCHPQAAISHATTPLVLLLGSLPFSVVGCALPLVVGHGGLTHTLVMAMAALAGGGGGGGKADGREQAGAGQDRYRVGDPTWPCNVGGDKCPCGSCSCSCFASVAAATGTCHVLCMLLQLPSLPRPEAV